MINLSIKTLIVYSTSCYMVFNMLLILLGFYLFFKVCLRFFSVQMIIAGCSIIVAIILLPLRYVLSAKGSRISFYNTYILALGWCLLNFQFVCLFLLLVIRVLILTLYNHTFEWTAFSIIPVAHAEEKSLIISRFPRSTNLSSIGLRGLLQDKNSCFEITRNNTNNTWVMLTSDTASHKPKIIIPRLNIGYISNESSWFDIYFKRFCILFSLPFDNVDFTRIVNTSKGWENIAANFYDRKKCTNGQMPLEEVFFVKPQRFYNFKDQLKLITGNPDLTDRESLRILKGCKSFYKHGFFQGHSAIVDNLILLECLGQKSSLSNPTHHQFLDDLRTFLNSQYNFRKAIRRLIESWSIYEDRSTQLSWNYKWFDKTTLISEVSPLIKDKLEYIYTLKLFAKHRVTMVDKEDFIYDHIIELYHDNILLCNRGERANYSSEALRADLFHVYSSFFKNVDNVYRQPTLN